VILPEGLAVFGQTLSPRLASNIELITGALPAQYGLRTAGIINITTKSGFKTGGEASIYGGSHNVITPSLEGGGSFGRSSAFGSLSYTGTDVGIESPDGRSTPLHDRSDRPGRLLRPHHHDASRLGDHRTSQQLRVPVPASRRTSACRQQPTAFASRT
jgi:hypothetical protein